MLRAVRLTLSLSLVLAAPLLPQDDGAEAPLDEARRALARLDFEAARSALDAVIDADSAGAATEAALLLRAVVRRQTDDPDGALADLRAIQDGAADQPVAQQARWTAADLLARLGRHQEALGLTRDVVSRLRAGERRHGIARLYIDAADELLRPPEATGNAPEHAAAYQLLRKVEELDAPGPAAAAVRIDLLRCADRLGRSPSERIERAREFLVTHGDDSAVPEALALLVRAHAGAGDLLAAQEVALRLADAAPGDPRTAATLSELVTLFLASGLEDQADLQGALIALERLDDLTLADDARRDRARQHLAVARAMSKRPALRALAYERLDRIAASAPASDPEAAAAKLAIADLREEDGAPEVALTLLSELIRDRPLDDLSRTAIRRIGEVARAALDDAVARGSGLEGAPREVLCARARRMAKRLVEHAPTDAAVPRIALTMARLEQREGRVDAAIERALEVARRFPGTGEAAEAELDVARWTAEEKHDYVGALERLRALETGPQSVAASRLRREIERPALRIEPTRPFPSGEPPYIVLHSRNIDETEIQLHRVDLEQVFLAAGTLDGLAALDVGLIRPDDSFSVTIDAAPHAPHERRIELPPPDGTGAIVVTARAGRLEARTAVVVSDLETLVIATAHATEVLGGPRHGDQRVRVSSDGSILPVERTAKERGSDAVREVFTVRDGHAASARVDTRGLAEAPARVTRGWLVVDRERARPGDVLRLFGVAIVPDGAAESVRLEWRDRRTGLLLRSTTPKPTEAGTFRDELTIAPSFEHETTIDVSLVAASTDGKERSVASAGTPVGAFPDPAVVAEWSSPRSVLLCGESTRLRAALFDAAGTPIANEPVEISLDGGESTGTRTDAGGVVFIEVPATRTALPGHVTARVVARGERRDRTLPVLSRSPIVVAKGRLANHPTVLVGDEMRLEFEVSDAREAPVAAELSVVVLAEDPVLRWREVHAESVSSDRRGRAAVSFVASRAGPHRVVVERDGGRGLPVRTEWNLYAAGDGDGLPVSLVPDTRRPRRGDRLRVTLHSELPDRGATLVLHDTTARGAVPITLGLGRTELSVPIPADAGSPFHVTCVVDDGTSVLTPTATVLPEVEFELLMDAATTTGTAGEVLDVELRAAGADGSGVATEALLVLVHEDERAGMLERLGAPLDALHPLSTGSFVRVASSAEFEPAMLVHQRDDAIDRALADIERAATAPGAAVMIESLALDRILGEKQQFGDGVEFNDVIGVGGGAGGKFGGRYGGRAGGGAAQERRKQHADAPVRCPPAPALFRTAVHVAADGRTSVSIPLPRRPGRWSLFAVGAARGQQIGVGRLSLDVVDPVTATLSAPTFSRPGDAAVVAARLTEREGAARTVQLRLALDGDELSVRRVALRAHESIDVSFPLPPLPVGDRRVRLLVDGRGHDATIAVEGRPIEPGSVRRGGATGDVTLESDSNDGRPIRLRIDASPLARAIATVLAPSSVDPRDAERAAYALWIAADTLAAARAMEGVPDPLAARLEEAARARLHAVVGLLPPRRDPARTAPILHAALGRAEAAGMDVPESIRAPLTKQVDDILATATHPDRRAWLLFLAGRASTADFAMLNRLHRERSALGTTGLAFLALALTDAGREEAARTTLAILETRTTIHDGAARLLPSGDGEVRGTSREEFDALVAATARRQDVRTPAIAATVERARAAEATAPAHSPLVVAVRSLESAPSAPRTIVVSREGRTVGRAELAGAWDGAELTIPVGTGVLRLRSSDGTPFLTRVEWNRLARSATPPPSPAGLSVTRSVRRTIAVRDGHRLAIDHRVVRAAGRDALPLETTRVASGRPVEARLVIRFGDAPIGAHWIDVPRPAWGTIELDSVRGADDAVLVGHRLRLLVPRRERDSVRTVRYVVVPGAPGNYRAPAISASFGRFAESGGVREDATESILVVAPGEDPDHDVPPSPDERYHVGLSAFARGDHVAARAALVPLAELPLENAPFLETTRTLMLASAATGDAEETVRFFEILKERDPSFVVPFETIERVGAAYARLGEPERARQIAMAIVDATFLEEAQVVGRLESAGLQRRALRGMERLLAEYGETPAAAEVRFAFGMHAYDQAKATDASFPGDRRRPDRGTLFRLAVDVLLQRLALSPRATDRDEVLLTLVNVLVDAGRYDEGRALAAAAMRTIAEESRLRASFRFVEAHASFALQDLDRALALAESLATDRFPDGTALLDDLRAMGRHLAGQIHHARGDLDEARREYASVREQFPDAARALAWLERQGLTIPAVTRARTGEPLRLSIEHRGVATSLEVKAFPIDLRALFLKHRGLDRLNEVRLEGIAPAHAAAYPLAPHAAGIAESEVRLTLDEPGAWLLLVRAGDLYARGLALRSDLTIDADASPESVRVHAAFGPNGRPRAGALVTFAGDDFSTRRTDLRGICEVPAASGALAAIAEVDDHWAFLQVASSAPTRAAADAPSSYQRDDHLKRSQQVLDGARLRNNAIWSDNTNRDQRGVEVEPARK